MIFFSEKILFLHMFSNISLVSSALIFAIIVIADNKPMDLCYRCYKYFIIYILMRIMLKYIEIQVEINSFIFK